MLYLIHFERPLSHARHYLGFVESSDGLQARLKRHADGNGAVIMAAVQAAGIAWQVVRTWPDGTRTDERRLKRQKHHWRFCPIYKREKTNGSNP